MAKPKAVIVIVENPNHTRVINEGEAPTTMAAWRVPIEDGKTIDETVQAWAMQLIAGNQLPVGSSLHYVSDSKVETRKLEPQLV